jgi:hypothetical protein
VLLDYEYGSAVPNVFEKQLNLLSVDVLKVEKLVDLHRIEGMAGLVRLTFLSKFTQISHVYEVEMLEILPPRLQRCTGYIVSDQVEFDLSFCFQLSLVVPSTLPDTVATFFGLSQGRGKSDFGQHENVKPFPFVRTVQNVL